MTDLRHLVDSETTDVIGPHLEESNGPSEAEMDRPTRPQSRAGWLAWHRLAWWLELAVVGACYLIYETSRTFASSERGPAVAHGRQIFAAEQWVHLDPEGALNRWLSQWNGLSDVAAYYYSTLHFGVTPLVLVYLFWRHPEAYPRLRSALIMATGAGLAVYLLWPVAPPRFAIPGLTDTLTKVHVLGMSNSHGVSGLVNQYAAMPSLHVGWALWCAVSIVVTQRSRWRHLAWLYPAATTFVVMATANHYLFDAFGGALVLYAALLVTSAHRRRKPAGTWTMDDLSGALR